MDAADMVRTARKGAGLSQVEIARRAGTSQAAVSAVERGASDVTVSKAARLVAAAGYELVLARVREPHPDDLDMMRLNLDKTPAARLAGFCNLLRLRGTARR